MCARYWVGVVSQDHVLKGISGGFAQVGHGKEAPLRRMASGDWLIYYSPRMEYGGAEACRAFTAIGEVAGERVYQVEVTPEFRPFRRDVHFLAAHDAPIAPLLDRLSFTADRRNWGSRFRFGHFEIPEADFHLIAEAMGIGAAVESPRAAPPGRSAERIRG